MTKDSLKYEDLLGWFKSNASIVCADDSLKKVQLTVGTLGSLTKPFSDLYFTFDHDESGLIEPNDMRRFFRRTNTNGDPYISKDEFRKALDSNLLEYCIESKKI